MVQVIRCRSYAVCNENTVSGVNSVGLTAKPGGDTFYCERLEEKTSTAFCLIHFVDDTALKVYDSPCFKCSQGDDIRNEFADK